MKSWFLIEFTRVLFRCMRADPRLVELESRNKTVSELGAQLQMVRSQSEWLRVNLCTIWGTISDCWCIETLDSAIQRISNILALGVNYVDYLLSSSASSTSTSMTWCHRCTTWSCWIELISLASRRQKPPLKCVNKISMQSLYSQLLYGLGDLNCQARRNCMWHRSFLPLAVCSVSGRRMYEWLCWNVVESCSSDLSYMGWNVLIFSWH